MKICILTQPLYSNYGGLLQAFALQTVLKRMGHEVVTDKYGAPRSLGKRILYFSYHCLKRYILQDKRYNPFDYLFTSFNNRFMIMRKQAAVNTDRFINDHIDTINFFQGKCTPQKNMQDQFEAFLVGSDQVWRPLYSYIPAYYLNFVMNNKSVRKITYAASFGVDSWEYSPRLTKQCIKLAKQFNAISVREDSGVKLCQKYLGVEALHLLDPTLLLNKEDYLSVIEEVDRKMIWEKKMMCYILDQTPNKRAIISRISSELGLSPLDVMPENKLTAATNDVSCCVFPSVSAWLAGFRDAEFVVSDSFHGTVFAIIFNKPFVTILNTERGISRFTSMLRIFNLENRIIGSLAELSEVLPQPIDYISVNQIREEWKMKSLSFLSDYLT